MCAHLMCPGAHGTQSLLPSQTHTRGTANILQSQSCHPLPGMWQHLLQLFSNGWGQCHSLDPWYHPLVSSCCSWSVVFLSQNSSLSFTTFHNVLFCILCHKIIFLNSNPMVSLKGVSSLPGLIYVCHELSAVRAGLLQPSPQQDKGSAC